MPAARTKSEIMSLLRESVADMRPRAAPALPFGISNIDERLADGGLDGAALHEVAAAAASLSDDAAATLFVAGITACFAAAGSPVEQGRLVADRTLVEIANTIGGTPAQIALAWAMRRDGVIAIPKAGSVAHIRENRAAADLVLLDADLAALDAAFPRPRDRRPLETL